VVELRARIRDRGHARPVHPDRAHRARGGGRLPLWRPPVLLGPKDRGPRGGPGHGDRHRDRCLGARSGYPATAPARSGPTPQLGVDVGPARCSPAHSGVLRPPAVDPLLLGYDRAAQAHRARARRHRARAPEGPVIPVRCRPG
jgi:hypothetical protein